jgi:hypothetical protein
MYPRATPKIWVRALYTSFVIVPSALMEIRIGVKGVCAGPSITFPSFVGSNFAP